MLFRSIAPNYYYASMDGVTGTGYSMDLGAYFTANNFEASLSAINIVPTKINYSDDTEEKLPSFYRAGVKYGLWDEYHFLGQIESRFGKTYLSYGVKYTPQIIFKAISVSAGLNEYESVSKKFVRPTLGVSLKLPMIQFHLAYKPNDYDKDNKSYFFSTNINF